MGECCSNDKCCCKCHTQHRHEEEENHEEFAHCLLEIADEAWMEVLKDEIKKHILSTQGDRMTELAKLISESNSERWKNKMEKKRGCHTFKEKLCAFFGQHK